jgi:hypothetical protein
MKKHSKRYEKAFGSGSVDLNYMVCRLLLGFFQTVVRHSFRGKDKEIGKKR